MIRIYLGVLIVCSGCKKERTLIICVVLYQMTVETDVSDIFCKATCMLSTKSEFKTRHKQLRLA